MATEIERKFLVNNESWRQEANSGTEFIQGYLVGSGKASVRVRIEGDEAFINIKSATLGIYRQEYEYPLPIDDARELLYNLCDKPLIEKTRYLINAHDVCWEIDVFKGENAGLVVAEVELESEYQSFEQPAWLGKEVSDDPRYYNVSLVKHPFHKW